MPGKATARKSRSVKEPAVFELVEAVMAKNLAAVRRSLHEDADVDKCRVDGFTPLILAAGGGDTRITAYLIDRGANVNARNDTHATKSDRPL